MKKLNRMLVLFAVLVFCICLGNASAVRASDAADFRFNHVCEEWEDHGTILRGVPHVFECRDNQGQPLDILDIYFYTSKEGKNIVQSIDGNKAVIIFDKESTEDYEQVWVTTSVGTKGAGYGKMTDIVLQTAMDPKSYGAPGGFSKQYRYTVTEYTADCLEGKTVDYTSQAEWTIEDNSTWEAPAASDGLSISSSGLLTVLDAAKPGYYSVRAELMNPPASYGSTYTGVSSALDIFVNAYIMNKTTNYSIPVKSVDNYDYYLQLDVEAAGAYTIGYDNGSISMRTIGREYVPSASADSYRKTFTYQLEKGTYLLGFRSCSQISLKGETPGAETEPVISHKTDGKNSDSDSSGTGGKDEGSGTSEEPAELKTGDVFTASGAKFLLQAGGAVQYQAPAKTAKKVTVPATVKDAAGKSHKVTSIAAKAFKGNTKMTSCVIGKNVKTIGKYAFSGCKNLKTLTIGANVTTIGQNAFSGCAALTTVVIPEKAAKIGAKAFYGDKKLTTIKIKTAKLTAAKVGKAAFKGISAKAVIRVPAKKLKAYKTMLRKRGLTKKHTIKRL